MSTRKRKLFHLDPELRLSELPMFIWTFILFIAIATACTLIILYYSNLKLDFTYEGFNFGLFTVFRVPLAILAAMISILGFIAAIHKSAQTSLQIKKTSEQNIFANYYKHRQEYVDHLNEIKDKFPDHIKSELDEKVIRGFYKSTYPFNNPIEFSTSSRVTWLEYFDKNLIEMCYFLAEMPKAGNEAVLSYLWREFNRLEVSLRQNFFHLNTPEEGMAKLPHEKYILVEYWDGSFYNLSVWDLTISTLFDRIYSYADLIAKLKSAAEEFEGTMLYGTEVYDTLSSKTRLPPGMEMHVIPNEGVIKKLYESPHDAVSVRKEDLDIYTKIAQKINSAYNKKIAQLDSIRDKNLGN